MISKKKADSELQDKEDFSSIIKRIKFERVKLVDPFMNNKELYKGFESIYHREIESVLFPKVSSGTLNFKPHKSISNSSDNKSISTVDSSVKSYKYKVERLSQIEKIEELELQE